MTAREDERITGVASASDGNSFGVLYLAWG